MNVLQHTRNELNLCLKQNRPDRSYRDTLLSFNVIENLLCLGFISLYVWFCYVIFTRIILSIPACDVLLYVRLKTTCAAIKFRKRLLTISKINITPWNMYRDNNFHSRRYVLRVSVSENKWAYTHKLQKPCRFKPASRCLRQNEPRGKNIAQSFLFTAKSITKYIVFCVTFSLYLWSENVKTFKNL